MRKLAILPVLLLAAALVPVAIAAPLTHLVVYGDSLYDNGNFYAASRQPPWPYWNGRISNGPVAAEILAANAGLALLDFAWAGATTGVGNINDMGTTIAFGSYGLPGVTTAFNLTKAGIAPLASSSLFLVSGGAMDFYYPADPTPELIVNRGVTNLLLVVGELQAMGARKILVAGLPDLGLTPRIMGYGPDTAAAFSQITDAFNQALKSNLPPGVIYFDTASLLRSLIANPAAYGFTNVTEPCFDESGPSICSNPDEYLFWDGIHPTAATHAILADRLQASVPEPNSLLLVGLSLLVPAALGIRRKPRI